MFETTVKFLLAAAALLLSAYVLKLSGLAELMRGPSVGGFEKLTGEDAVITLTDGRQFRGRCADWRALPSGLRAAPDVAKVCSEEWTRQMWRRP